MRHTAAATSTITTTTRRPAVSWTVRRATIAHLTGGRRTERRSWLVAAPALSGVMTALVVWSAQDAGAGLGAAWYWPWLLTALQVLALWAAGADRWWGWLLGGLLQGPWIAYAVVTAQLGFIPGCVVSAVVQGSSYLRHRSPVPAEPPHDAIGPTS